jgi:hypothetical protein
MTSTETRAEIKVGTKHYLLGSPAALVTCEPGPNRKERRKAEALRRSLASTSANALKHGVRKVGGPK